MPWRFDSITNGSGILDHPLSRMMTAADVLRIQFQTAHHSQPQLRDLAAPAREFCRERPAL
jgi:hypothetical protein